jgi:hypothetical protein
MEVVLAQEGIPLEERVDLVGALGHMVQQV